MDSHAQKECAFTLCLKTYSFARGKYAEAEPLYQRALAIYEQQLGPDHPSTATILENYAFLLRWMRRSNEAVPLEQRARTIRAKRQRS